MKNLGCVTGNYNDCCGDKRFGCCDISAMRFSDAGPALYTQEWDIGARGCAGNLKKCVGKCGNKYCSANGKCSPDVSQIPYITESYEGCDRRMPYSKYGPPSAVGVL